MDIDEIRFLTAILEKYGLNHVLGTLVSIDNKLWIENHNKWVKELNELGKNATP